MLDFSPDDPRMVAIASDAKLAPPPADLLAEHHIHQLGVVVVVTEGAVGAVGLIVDVLQVNLATRSGDG